MYLGYIWLYRDSIEKAFLWPDQAQLKAAVTEFLPCADILKLSDEELFFITGKEHIADAVEELFAMGISVILYTKEVRVRRFTQEQRTWLCPAVGKRQWIRPERETDLLVLSLTNSLMRGEPWMT